MSSEKVKTGPKINFRLFVFFKKRQLSKFLSIYSVICITTWVFNLSL